GLPRVRLNRLGHVETLLHAPPLARRHAPPIARVVRSGLTQLRARPPEPLDAEHVHEVSEELHSGNERLALLLPYGPNLIAPLNLDVHRRVEHRIPHVLKKRVDWTDGVHHVRRHL